MNPIINLTNKQGLEGLFAEDFGSPYFPVLADLYLQEGDYRRAKLVCEVGLKHDESNDCGKYILAKVAMAEKKLLIAEKWLKQTVDSNPANFNALRLLIKIEFDLKRSHKTIKKYIKRIIHFLPKDEDCRIWLQEIDHADIQKKSNINDTDTTDVKKINDRDSINQTEPSKDPKYELEESMVTFTMLQVLKSQKHYEKALAVLSMLEAKNMDTDRISKEREEIYSLLANDDGFI